MSDVMNLSAVQVEAMDETQAREVLGAWVKARRTELPEALSASSSKLHARLAKKALYQLGSSGVAAQARPAPMREALAPAQRAPEEFHAVLSAILGTGERAVFFGQPRRGGGFDAYQGIISDELGVLQLNHSVSSRADYRRHVKTLQNHPTLKVLVVPLTRMKLELSRALGTSDRVRHDLPAEAQEILRTLTILPGDDAWEVPAPKAGDEALAAGGAALLKEPELEQWLPSEPAIAALGQKLAELEEAPLGPAQKLEEADRRTLADCAAYLTPERRKIYGRRLWAMAELLEHSQRITLAPVAQAEARRLFHTLERSPFFEAMFRSLATQHAEHSAQKRTTEG